jgi:hypothetical protein
MIGHRECESKCAYMADGVNDWLKPCDFSKSLC